MARNVKQALTEVSPRTLFDPRESYRYLSRLASRLVKWQGGLVLRSIIEPESSQASASSGARPDIRAIA